MTSRHLIFGTAGHVDHGKSSLVFALTGTDPDRLEEEKAREMTIDLGFAFLALPGHDEKVAIVDVPGHEMFIRNMVAGATGVDAAIFVVAADEGVMPQTIEHLEVLRHLRVSDGVVALTKIDRTQPEQIERSRRQVLNLLAGTLLSDVAIIPVSSVTRQGLDELLAELAHVADRIQTRSSEGIFRLPVDRVFTLRGAGTVVTGTVVSGSLRVGEVVACLPRGREVRARSLQVHGKSVERISAGQRAAINLTDTTKDQVERGDVLATPGALAASLMIDCRISLSPNAAKPLLQRTRLRVHHETREVMARVVLLENDVFMPGKSALVQLRLEAPLIPAAGDLLVIRSYSPTVVIGGGSVVDAHPPKRRKAKGAEEVAEREELSGEELILEVLIQAKSKGVTFDDLRVKCSLSEIDLQIDLDSLTEEGKVRSGRRRIWFTDESVREMQDSLIEQLTALHVKDPLNSFASLSILSGIVAPQPEERECFRLALDSVMNEGTVIVEGERIRLKSHVPQWTGKDAEIRDRILRKLRISGLASPTVPELATAIGEIEAECQRILTALAGAHEVVLIAPGIYTDPAVLLQSRTKVIEYLQKHGKMSIADARELLNASRKYLLPFLEKLDREGLTTRQGDIRVLSKRR